jgi:hypothetical protein
MFIFHTIFRLFGIDNLEVDREGVILTKGERGCRT